eukprot:UN02007
MKRVGLNVKLPNCCNVNYYANGEQKVGWHSDNEPLYQSKYRDCLIVSLSIGATRTFQFRKNWTQDNPTTIKLKSGDLMTMEGLFQRFYVHRVPSENKGSVGPRINFTWRWITFHSRNDGCSMDGRNAGAIGHFFRHLKTFRHNNNHNQITIITIIIITTIIKTLINLVIIIIIRTYLPIYIKNQIIEIQQNILKIIIVLIMIKKS